MKDGRRSGGSGVGRRGSAGRIVLVLAAGAVLFFSGCGDKADDAGQAAAEEMTGARKIEQGEDLKARMRQIDKQRKDQEERARGE